MQFQNGGNFVELLIKTSRNKLLKSARRAQNKKKLYIIDIEEWIETTPSKVCYIKDRISAVDVSLVFIALVIFVN